VLVGHSQGGHSVLSALALAETYGVEGTLAGVGVYAPLWLSQRSWGAILDKELAFSRNYTITNLGAASSVSVWYHYTQAELLDGPGEGIKLFTPAKQAAVKKFIDEACWGELKTLEDNATYAYELFEPAFTQSVGFPATGLGGGCTNGTCEKWLARYSADRPHLTGKAATTPIYLAYGLKDTTIDPGRMACALDRLKADGAKLTVCVDAEAGHGSILDTAGERVSDWIASLTLGGAAPAACAQNESAITASCSTPPPND